MLFFAGGVSVINKKKDRVSNVFLKYTNKNIDNNKNIKKRQSQLDPVPFLWNLSGKREVEAMTEFLLNPTGDMVPIPLAPGAFNDFWGPLRTMPLFFFFLKKYEIFCFRIAIV